MRVYLTDTNGNRQLVIEDNKKWYYYAHEFTECSIYDNHVEVSLVNLTMWVIAYNDIDLDNFEHIERYDGMNWIEVMDYIEQLEGVNKIPTSDRTMLYYAGTIAEGGKN